MISDDGGSLPEVVAGGGMGVLVGLLVGLSVSPVVGTILGALAALLVTFLGLTEGKTAADPVADPALPRRARGRSVRAGAFGLACALAIVIGIVIRTHGLLSVPLDRQVAAWEAAGYTKSEAQQLVAYRELGIVPSGRSVAAETALAPKTATGGLFGARSQSECSQLERERYRDQGEELNAYKEAGGGWALLAQAIRTLPAPRQREILTAGWSLACGR